jgi:hypothetical protein
MLLATILYIFRYESSPAALARPIDALKNRQAVK